VPGRFYQPQPEILSRFSVHLHLALQEGDMVGAAICAMWGHAVDNAVFTGQERACTRCGVPCLHDDVGAVMRIGHTLSCFLHHHTYERVGFRDGHTEYACVRCGHPLLFRTDTDPYGRSQARFAKRVRYLCGLFGHRVHAVVERDGGSEYACRCGHSFVHRDRHESIVRHPLACVLLGHWVAFVRPRAAYSEYACRRCGHPFLFASVSGRAAVAGRG
jgi:DNA-directed RNA polymerase subunit RPC12/RpoP